MFQIIIDDPTWRFSSYCNKIGDHPRSFHEQMSSAIRGKVLYQQMISGKREEILEVFEAKL